MKKSILVALAVVGAAAAHADSTYPYNFSIRLGVVFPIDNSYSNISDSFAGAGLEYAFEKSFVAGGESYLSLDYQGKDFGKTKGTVMPLCLNQKWFTGDQQLGLRSYYFLGVGAAFVDYNGSEAAACARLGVGKEFNQNLFGEISLLISDQAAAVRPNSINLYVGWHF
jgi:hypothetical protein